MMKLEICREMMKQQWAEKCPYRWHKAEMRRTRRREMPSAGSLADGWNITFAPRCVPDIVPEDLPLHWLNVISYHWGLNTNWFIFWPHWQLLVMGSFFYSVLKKLQFCVCFQREYIFDQIESLAGYESHTTDVQHVKLARLNPRRFARCPIHQSVLIAGNESHM